eukprot:Lithocolla_globosa_v1_NODE_8442_length_820_cov_67.725490.p3 type:complete len:103 gc:universal NODE_8442_length_820_cov_67.725490:462-154(-)
MTQITKDRRLLLQMKFLLLAITVHLNNHIATFAPCPPFPNFNRKKKRGRKTIQEKIPLSGQKKGVTNVTKKPHTSAFHAPRKNQSLLFVLQTMVEHASGNTS